MKTRTTLIYLVSIFLLAFTTCKKDPQPIMERFDLSREDLTVGTTSANIVGTYTYSGIIDEIMVCVSENGVHPAEFIADINGKNFTVEMTGLRPATSYQYYYSIDYGFSKPFITETKSFTTYSESPEVKALEWLKIDSTRYRITCQVVADGGSEVTERGICWNTFGSPIPHDDSTKLYTGPVEESGEYVVRMEHLDLGKKYYVRAFAKNAADKTGLSEVMEFQTEAPAGQPVEIELSCNPEEGGTVTGGGTYEIGTQCTARAVANSGYTFINWTENGNQVSSEATYTFPVTIGHNLVANFTKQAYVITAKVTPDNSGTVTGAGGYNYGEECTLTATPNTGYEFVKWTKGGSTVSTQTSYTFTVTETAEYEAHFKIKSYTIIVSADPGNGGSVEGGGTYDHGQSCTVKATPAEGYAFTNWTDDGEVASESAEYPFTVTGSRNLVANFKELQPDEYSIQVSANPTEGGTVTGGGTYHEGDQCKVKATSNAGFTFINWTENGTQVSVLAEYEFTVEGNRILVANFEAQAPTEYTITVSANPSNGGTVTGGGTYQHGDQCTVEATMNEGYTFINWTEDGEVASTNARYTFIVNSDRNLVANFQVQSYTISVSADPTNGGTVSGGGTYNHGENCTVSATANNGYTFTNWTENGNVVYEGANYTFTVERDRTLVAHFVVQAPNTYNINVSANPSNGGIVTGGGTYNQGASCTVSATAATDYRFTRWTENGNQVSTQADYNFPVNSNRNLVADFITRPTVTTAQVTNIQQTTATGGGNVTNSGGATVTERGICWSTSQNPSLTNGSHQQASSGGTGTFVVNMTSLTPGTTYYVRAYAINSEGTRYGNQENFQTQQYYTISASANPTNGGTATVSGNGNFIYNQVCTLTATQASGYTFNRWTKNGVEVSTQNPFSFNVTESGNYVAQFQVNVTVPTVITTDPVTNIQQTIATGGGNVTNSGGATVTARGVCWSTSSNPTINNSHTTNGTGTGIFTSSITGLTAGTIYHVRAYATNSAGTAYGADVTFTTQQVPTYTISVFANPSNGGTVSGGGTYNQGASCTVHAQAATNYQFTNWTENGSVVSTQANYQFTVNSNRTLVANFTYVPPTYTITVSANPSSGGTVSGGGPYQQGQTCMVQATANSNYTFSNWTEGGTVVSTQANYTFTVNGNRTLVANFNSNPLWPNGVLPGYFSVSTTQQVQFSQGNLQYIGSASTPYWKFADHQWDYLGDNGQGSTSQTVDRDLFGWGTSGWNNGNVYYQPYDTQNNGNSSQGYGYGPTDGISYTYDLTGTYANADWGVRNPISNGGGQAGQWRTLTKDEWVYVFQGRSGASSKYGHGKVNGQNGMILLPDEWTLPSGLSFTAGNSSWANVYTTEQWEQMEQNGAVFLPAAGIRFGTSIPNLESRCHYWSASCNGSNSAYIVDLFDSGLNPQNYGGRYGGLSVRLVRYAQ